MNELIANPELTITVLIIGALLISIFRKRYLFKILIEYTKVEIIYGEPPEKFIDECKKAVLFHKPKKGYVYGKSSDGVMKIIFSKQFDENKKQVFRNLWTEYPAIEKRNGKRRK